MLLMEMLRFAELQYFRLLLCLTRARVRGGSGIPRHAISVVGDMSGRPDPRFWAWETPKIKLLNWFERA